MDNYSRHKLFHKEDLSSFSIAALWNLQAKKSSLTSYVSYWFSRILEASITLELCCIIVNIVSVMPTTSACMVSALQLIHACTSTELGGIRTIEVFGSRISSISTWTEHGIRKLSRIQNGVQLEFPQCVVRSIEIAFQKHWGYHIELLMGALLLSDEICSARPTIHKSLNGCLLISSNLFLRSHLCPI